MTKTDDLFEVIITTDRVVGRENWGGSSSHKFKEKSEMIGYLQEIFKGKKPYFASGMAVHESTQETVTACIYINHKQVDASSFI